MIIVRQDTKLGELVVKESAFTAEGYPGYIISLVKDNVVLAETMLEVDETYEEPLCKVHVWDTTSDETICDLVGEEINHEMTLEMY